MNLKIIEAKKGSIMHYFKKSTLPAQMKYIGLHFINKSYSIKIIINRVK
jgi:hypothetical protein